MHPNRSFSFISVSSRAPEEAVAPKDEDGNADLCRNILPRASNSKLEESQNQPFRLALGDSLDGGFLNGLVLDSDVEILSSSDEERIDKGFNAVKQKGDLRSAKPEDTATTSAFQVVSLRVAEQNTKSDGIQLPQKDDKRKNLKKKRKKVESLTHPNSPERKRLFKVIGDDSKDNLVMRKLLRGSRYFDSLDEKTCFRCGNIGHIAANCAGDPRRKACYACGRLDHEGKDCPQGSCFVCKGIGHFAKSCPSKSIRIDKEIEGAKICLRCGNTGHEMIVCDRDYRLEDLKVIQCYVCKKFGHLCCVDIVDHLKRQVSCYNCGELRHIGVGCPKGRSRNHGEKQNAKVCFNCGEEGHFARYCSKRDEDGLWSDPWTPDVRNSQSLERFRGFKSVPAATTESRWTDMQLEERHTHTPALPSWPERWSMAREMDRWENLRVIKVDNEPPIKLKRHSRHTQSREKLAGSGSRKGRGFPTRKDGGNYGYNAFFH